MWEAYRPRRLVDYDLSEQMPRPAREKAARRGSYATFVQGDASALNAGLCLRGMREPLLPKEWKRRFPSR